MALSVLRSVVNISEKSKQKAEETLFSVEQISGAIDEIAKGASQQAVEVRQEVQKIESLSAEIGLLSENFNGVINDTQEINELNTIGLQSVSLLQVKPEETNDALDHIYQTIESLTNSTGNIELLLESVESIARQTNLLALNAATEAAASSGEIAATAENQVLVLEEMKNITYELDGITHKLDKKLEKFQL